MAFTGVNKNAARFEPGGVEHSGVMVSERRVVVDGRDRANPVVLCPVLVEAADLGRVVDIERV